MEIECGMFIDVSSYAMDFNTKKAFREYERKTADVIVNYVRKFFDEDISNAKRWFSRHNTPNYAIVGDDTVVGFARNFDDATLMCEAIVAASPYYREVRVFSYDGLFENECYERSGSHCYTNHLYHWAKGECYTNPQTHSKLNGDLI